MESPKMESPKIRQCRESDGNAKWNILQMPNMMILIKREYREFEFGGRQYP